MRIVHTKKKKKNIIVLMSLSFPWFCVTGKVGISQKDFTRVRDEQKPHSRHISDKMLKE